MLFYQTGQIISVNQIYNLFKNRLSDKFYFRIFAHVVKVSQNKFTTWGQTFGE